MTKDEAKKIILSAIPKLTTIEQTAVKILTSEVEENSLRVNVIDETHQEFNGDIYTKREKSGYYVTWKTLHKEVMKYHCGGKIPEGFIVHHNAKDKYGRWDINKNNVEDLLLVTNEEHYQLHHKRKLKLEADKQAVCTVCGKEFMSKFHGGSNRPFLCSKKCKNVWVKNKTEERKCVVCGKTFSICKYKKTQCCSRHCGNILGHKSRKKEKN